MCYFSILLRHGVHRAGRRRPSVSRRKGGLSGCLTANSSFLRALRPVTVLKHTPSFRLRGTAPSVRLARTPPFLQFPQARLLPSRVLLPYKHLCRGIAHAGHGAANRSVDVGGVAYEVPLTFNQEIVARDILFEMNGCGQMPRIGFCRMIRLYWR